MNLHSGYFPPHGYRRKGMNNAYHFPLTQSNSASSLQSARSSLESSTGNDSFLPSISTATVHDSRQPYHRNDFANNHLFLAKRKLAGILLEQPTRNLQATSELIHLFDSPETRRRKTKSHKHRQQVHLKVSFSIPFNLFSFQNGDKNNSSEQDAHLSVVNLVIKPPQLSLPTRDPLSLVLRQRRSHGKSNLPLNPLNDEHQSDESFDDEYQSEILSNSIPPLNPSILSVKSIVPSIAPQHGNHR